jgi:hypothetical protein
MKLSDIILLSAVSYEIQDNSRNIEVCPDKWSPKCSLETGVEVWLII